LTHVLSAAWTGSMARLRGACRSMMAMSNMSCSRGGASCSCGGRHSSGGRVVRGKFPPSSSPRANTSTLAPRSLLSLHQEPASQRGSETSVTSSGNGLETVT
jgi:hypothetical protein